MGTAHAIVGVGMTREALYVAATRGRDSNRLYVDVEPEPANAGMAHGPTERLGGREVLLTVISRRGAELSAHQTMASEWARAASFEQLAREHQSLVAAAMAQRWEAVLGQAGLPPALLAKAEQSPEWAVLLGVLRDAEDRGLDPKAALFELAKLPIGQDQDPASVLQARLRRWEEAAGGRWSPRRDLVVGLVPKAVNVDDGELASAVREREAAIARRAHDLAEQAVRAGAPWARVFGPPPVHAAVANAWWGRIAVVAAYRDRWHITDDSILGDKERRLPPASCSSCPGIACRAGSRPVVRVRPSTNRTGSRCIKPPGRTGGGLVSRAARRYKKWERDTRKSAWEEARQLALDLYYGHAGPVNPYGIGMALEPGEVMYRQMWARYWTLGQPLDLVNGYAEVRFVPSSWRDWGWCLTVLTSHRTRHSAWSRRRAADIQLVAQYWGRAGRPFTRCRNFGRPHERLARRVRRPCRCHHLGRCDQRGARLDCFGRTSRSEPLRQGRSRLEAPTR